MITENSPVSAILKQIESKLSGEHWPEFEMETIAIEAQLPFTKLMQDKIHLIKAIKTHPEIFYTNYLFFLHSTEVLNNKVAHFETLPHVTSLEMAFAITDMAKCLNVDVHHSPSFKKEVIVTIRSALIEEGFSEPLHPFDLVGVGELPKGQTEKDTANKQKAIDEYIKAMYR